MPDSQASTRSDLVRQQALVAVRPLIAWLVRSGVGHADFAAALKPLFLELAREELISHQHRINDESLRTLVEELDLAEVSSRKRLSVARRALGLPPAEAGD